MDTNSPTKFAFLFPGQASQITGMGSDIYENSLAAKEVFDEIDDTLGRKLTDVIFNGDNKELTRTENAQPSITAVSLATWKAMEEKTDSFQIPTMAAGHSLGEYSALAVSGALTIPETIRLVAERGRLMQFACDKRPGGMAAIVGVDEQTVEEVCRESGTYISNINTAQQIIISGDHMRLARAIDLAAARGAKRAIPLVVDGAFHSGLMEPAQNGLNEVIESFDFEDPVFPIIGNVSARKMESATEIKSELKMQLQCCVQWNKSIGYMLDEGITEFIEIGPGRVLSGMVKRISRQAKILNVGDVPSLEMYAEVC